MGVIFDKRGIREAFKEQEREVDAFLRALGENAVDYAVQNGSYHDVTGTLRKSNGYKVEGNKLTVFNDAPYASEVEARGEDVLKGAEQITKQYLQR